MTVELPQPVRFILETLNRAGFEAFAVGGCVRDSLLGRTVHDWDIASSAHPEEVKACFAEEKVIETGIQHGTVTLLLDGLPYEITTYRVDGAYSDGRRPDSVLFTDRLTLDLSRRDFTVNAMAYHPERGLIDCFGGIDHLKAGVISCVGEPERRFGEDALRILRAVRFCSALGFSLSPSTKCAMEALCPLVKKLAAERVAGELSRILLGEYAGRALRENAEIIAQIIPELSPCMGFDQKNPYHFLDVWEHSVKALENAPKELPLRLALLLHDVAKPFCCSEDEKGIRHFYGHAAESARLAQEILERLRFDHKTRSLVTELVFRHDLPLEETTPLLKKRLNRFGEDFLRRLILVQKADCSAQVSEIAQERMKKLDAVLAALNEIVAQGQCFSLKDLAVNGQDLLNLGIPAGPEVGQALCFLLEGVLEGTFPNRRETLLKALQDKKKEKTDFVPN